MADSVGFIATHKSEKEEMLHPAAMSRICWRQSPRAICSIGGTCSICLWLLYKLSILAGDLAADVCGARRLPLAPLACVSSFFAVLTVASNAKLCARRCLCIGNNPKVSVPELVWTNPEHVRMGALDKVGQPGGLGWPGTMRFGTGSQLLGARSAPLLLSLPLVLLAV